VNVSRAGYNPQGIADLFQVLLKERESRPTQVEGWFASHPLEETRIDRAKQLIATLPIAQGKRFMNDSPEFHEFKARIESIPLPPVRSQSSR
jgi:predicted Zn-dependent protease